MQKQPSNSLRTFAQDFFTRFGAEVLPGDDDVIVNLPPDLAETFGKSRLYLVFADEESGERRELSPNEDLLVYGSRTFDQMLALLEGRGARANFQLPARFPADLDLTVPFVPPRKMVNLTETEYKDSREQLHFFHFRVIYTWSEKEEALISIVLDQFGRPCPSRLKIMDEGYAFLPLDDPLETDADSLRELFGKAQKMTEEHIRPQVGAIEAKIEARLQKILFRLNMFYQRLMADINTEGKDKDEQAQADLEADLKRKIADELERHSLQVDVMPIGYAIVVLPIGEHFLRLSTTHGEQVLWLNRDLYSGQLVGYYCHTCLEPLAKLLLLPKDAPLPLYCSEGCPLQEQHVVQGCLAMVGLPVEADVIPTVAGIKATQYTWRRVEDLEAVVYFGQRLGPKPLAPILGRVIIITDKVGTVVNWGKVGLWGRLGEMFS